MKIVVKGVTGMTRYDLLIVDVQNDFCHPDGALFVPGAPEDTRRLCCLLDHLAETERIRNFHITLDTHFVFDISHPAFWRDEKGDNAEPFTQIGQNDLASGKWSPTDPSAMERVLKYLEKLESTGKYRHTIWPEHCILGSRGHCMDEAVHKRVTAWERREGRRSDYVLKGMNAWTEHYSAIKAEVEDPEDPGTLVNKRLLEDLLTAEWVLISGQALSHCVGNTLKDMMEILEPSELSKLVLLEDATSSVPGFEESGEQILYEAKMAGVRICRTNDI